MNCYIKGHNLALENLYGEIAKGIESRIYDLGVRSVLDVEIARNRNNNHYNGVTDYIDDGSWISHPYGSITFFCLKYKSYIVIVTFKSKEFGSWHSEANVARLENIVHELMDVSNETFFTYPSNG